MSQQGMGQRGGPVTAQMLEERINMYIGAMDRANAINDGHQSSQLQRDIQRLVDLMEKVSAGQAVSEQEVPSPLVITPQIDVLANPLGELSSRLADYHKALYFAEEELSEERPQKIQRLQRGLQIIHGLQKRAQAGFPVRADEIPPPVIIPSDDEFDNDAVNTLNERYSQYKAGLIAAEKAEDGRKVSRMQRALRTIEFLFTRAKAKRPVWKKDIPPRFENQTSARKQTNVAKYMLQLKSLKIRLQSIVSTNKQRQQNVEEMIKKLEGVEELLTQPSGTDLSLILSGLTQQIEALEKLVEKEKATNPARIEEDLALVATRLEEYKAAALACKRDNQVNFAIKHFKVVKGLQALKEKLEKGEKVDMTQVPPPPREFTPTSESSPFFPEQEEESVMKQPTETPPGATANLTPVNIKPAVETAEDKLAKKLSSYLDKGDTDPVSSSEQLSSIHNINITSLPANQLLPKVQNSDRGKNAAANTETASSGESNLVPFGHDKAEAGGHTKKEEVSAVPKHGAEMQSIPSAVEAATTDSGPTKPVIQAAAATASETTSEQKGGQKQKDEEVSPVSHPQSPPTHSKTSDVYSRKTLESVGFLPCQNVPEQMHAKPKVPDVTPSLSNPEENKTEHKTLVTLTLDANLAHQNEAKVDSSIPDSITEVNEKDFATQDNSHSQDSATSGEVKHDFPSFETASEGQHITNEISAVSGSVPQKVTSSHKSEFTAISQKNKPSSTETATELDSSIPETASEKKSTFDGPTAQEFKENQVESQTLPETTTDHAADGFGDNKLTAHKDEQVISDLVRNIPQHGSSSGPSSITLPAHEAGKIPTQGDSGPASLPAAFMPDQARKELLGQKTPLYLSYVPDIPPVPKPTELVTTQPPPTEPGNVNQNFGSDVPVNGDVSQQVVEHHLTDFSASDDKALSSDDSSTVASSDLLEFQDLMDSMSMPIGHVPLSDNSVISNTHDGQHPSVDPTDHKVTQGSSSDQIVHSENSKVDSAANNLNHKHSHAMSREQTKYSPPVSQTQNNLAGAANDTVLPSNQSDTHMPESHALHGNHQTNDTESPMVTDATRNQQLGVQPSGLQSLSTVNQNHAAVKSHSAWSASAQSQTQSQDSYSLPQPTGRSWDSLPSLSAVSSSEEPGMRVLYLGDGPEENEVLFTCLENLKFDILINTAKGTLESEEELKKLKPVYEGIKMKLRHGGRQVWEDYKNSVEKELASLTTQIDSLRLMEQWNDIKLLSQKKTIAEKELLILRERLPALKY